MSKKCQKIDAGLCSTHTNQETRLVVDLNDETENLKKILSEIEEAKNDSHNNSHDNSIVEIEDLKFKHESLQDKYEQMNSSLKGMSGIRIRLNKIHFFTGNRCRNGKSESGKYEFGENG